MVIVVQGLTPLERSWGLALYREYASRCEVVFLSPDPQRPAVAACTDLRLALENARGGGRILSLPLRATLPGSRLRPVSALNRWLATRAIVSELRRCMRDEIVLIVQRPDLMPTLRGLGADLRVYEVVDDYEALAPDARAAERMRGAHARTLRESDLVWATSTVLSERIRSGGIAAVETTNGVEYESFARAAEVVGIRDVAGLESVPSPRIGLVGRLNDRIDWDLVIGLAERRADWRIVLVGPTYDAGPTTCAALERLAGLPNVALRDGVSPKDLPSCVAALDVGLIPYTRSRATDAINPLKVYQMLAAAKPVVATSLPSLARLGSVVRCVGSLGELIAGIEDALARRDDPTERAHRQAVARRFDWSRVAEDRLMLIRQALGAKRAPAAVAGRA